MNDSRRKRLLRKAEKAEKNEYDEQMGALGWFLLIPPTWPITLPLFLLFSYLSEERAKRLHQMAKPLFNRYLQQPTGTNLWALLFFYT
jgi:hypothetical protein